jgi:tetratricopeptide (TPR) repeat protein
VSRALSGPAPPANLTVTGAVAADLTVSTTPPGRGQSAAQQDSDSAAEGLHRQGVDANESGQPARAERILSRALTLAADRQLRARILVTLAHSQAEQGDGVEALSLLDDAQALTAGDDESRLDGLVRGQRGLLLLRLGRAAEAEEELLKAVRLLRGEGVALARMLLNLGVAQSARGDLARARASLLRCIEVAATADAPLVHAKAAHNLAYLDYLRGDLPAALHGFAEAARAVPPEDHAVSAASAADLAGALLLGGLTIEADRTLADAIKVLHQARLRQDEAQSWLVRAEVALEDGRRSDAAAHARAAYRLFNRRGSDSGTLLAQAIQLIGASSSHLARRALREEVESLSQDLAKAGLLQEARRLRLHVARALIAGQKLQHASEIAAPALRAERSDPLRTRLLARTVSAELALARGDRAAQVKEIRAGLADLQRHQSRLGSLELQTAVVRFGTELAEMGLRDAVASGRPSTTLHWLERTRALATRLPPVRAPEDAEMADLLGALRSRRLELRQLERDPMAAEHDVSAARRSCRDLERAAAARERQIAGAGTITAPVTLSGVRTALDAGPDDGALVTIFDVDDRLHALVVTSARADLASLGDLPPVSALVRRTRADLDVLALAGTAPRMREIVEASLRRSLALLDEDLLGPISSLLGDGPLALVPTGVLATLPWTLLPRLRGRPVSVARGPGEWLRGRAWPSPSGAAQASRSAQTRNVFVTGPRVERAEEEIRGCAAAWPDAEVLPLARPADLLDAASGADLLHVAAHGTHDAENPLFSSLELTEGLVFGHDLTRLAAAPRHVVLSACDLGLATARPGAESLGMTAALLHGGTRTVVAGVARVGDDVACEVAVAYHAQLSAGQPPSYALASALAETGADGSGDEFAPLTCFGSGW